MSLTPDAEPTENLDVSISLEIYPEDSSEVSLRQIAVGMQPLVLVALADGGVINLVVSSMGAEEALEFLSVAQLALHNYLGSEGK